jgi:hypothetical protein
MPWAGFTVFDFGRYPDADFDVKVGGLCHYGEAAVHFHLFQGARLIEAVHLIAPVPGSQRDRWNSGASFMFGGNGVWKEMNIILRLGRKA